MNPSYYHNYDNDINSYLEYALYDYPIHFHIAVNEPSDSNSIESLNFTEYYSTNPSIPSSYRRDFVTFEKTDDLSGYMIQRIVYY